MNTEKENRLDREKEFHNEVFSTGKREKTRKYYSTTLYSKQFYKDKVVEDVNGKRVLEYGCGPGSRAFTLAEKGAIVDAIDISEVAIALAIKEADKHCVKINFSVMNAEDLTFDDETFDLVCGSGILHHLDVDDCYKELNRVLKPGGSGIFFEPMGYNPFINLYRKLTPSLRTDEEHPLIMEDIELAAKYFEDVTTNYFHLTSITASFLPFNSLKVFSAAFLNRFDSLIFKTVPVLKKYAWITVLEFKNKKPVTSTGLSK